MQFHQWQVHCLGKPQPKPPVQVRIRVKATQRTMAAKELGAGWLASDGNLYTRHTAERIQDVTA